MSHMSERSALIDQDILDAADEIERCNAEIQNTPFPDDYDRYSEEKDEPPQPGTQEFDDCKGDYIYHQRSEE